MKVKCPECQEIMEHTAITVISYEEGRMAGTINYPRASGRDECPHLYTRELECPACEKTIWGAMDSMDEVPVDDNYQAAMMELIKENFEEVKE